MTSSLHSFRQRIIIGMIFLLSSACSTIRREISVVDEAGQPLKGALTVSELYPTGFFNMGGLPIGIALSVTDDRGRAAVSGLTSIFAQGYHPMIQEGYGGFEQPVNGADSQNHYNNSIHSLESALEPTPNSPALGRGRADGAVFSLFSRIKYQAARRTFPLFTSPFLELMGHKDATGARLATYRFLACPSASLKVVFHTDQGPPSPPQDIAHTQRFSFEINSSLPNLQRSKRFYFEKLAKTGWSERILNVPRFFCRHANGEIYKIAVTGLMIEGRQTCPNSGAEPTPCITISEVSRRVSEPEEAFVPASPSANRIIELFTEERRGGPTVKLFSSKEVVARALKSHLLDLGVEMSEIDRQVEMLDAAN